MVTIGRSVRSRSGSRGSAAAASAAATTSAGELRRDRELLLDAGDALAELVRGGAVVGARDVNDATGGHAVTLARRRPGSPRRHAPSLSPC